MINGQKYQLSSPWSGGGDYLQSFCKEGIYGCLLPISQQFFYTMWSVKAGLTTGFKSERIETNKQNLIKCTVLHLKTWIKSICESDMKFADKNGISLCSNSQDH